jgi:hypothetical protein
VDYAIEQKVIELLTTHLIDEETTYQPMYILPYAEDWAEEDFPVVVVQVENEENVVDQVSPLPSYLKVYSLYIYAISTSEFWNDVSLSKSILKSRIIKALKQHQDLDRLADNESSESVVMIHYISASFHIGGFNDRWRSQARLLYHVTVEVKPV